MLFRIGSFIVLVSRGLRLAFGTGAVAGASRRLLEAERRVSAVSLKRRHYLLQSFKELEARIPLR